MGLLHCCYFLFVFFFSFFFFSEHVSIANDTFKFLHVPHKNIKDLKNNTSRKCFLCILNGGILAGTTCQVIKTKYINYLCFLFLFPIYLKIF